MSEREQYARQAEEWTERAYADARAYLAHRADLVVALGPLLEPGDEVLDLACGDCGLGDVLLERGLRYRGVDSTPEMAAEARRRLGDRAPVDVGDLNDYVPPAPRRGDDRLSRDLLRARPPRLLPARRWLHREEARLRPQPAPVPARRRRSPTCVRRASTASRCAPSSSRRRSRCRALVGASRRRSSARDRSPASPSASASRYLVAACRG